MTLAYVLKFELVMHLNQGTLTKLVMLLSLDLHFFDLVSVVQPRLLAIWQSFSSIRGCNFAN
jgi:hypothetical protein